MAKKGFVEKLIEDKVFKKVVLIALVVLLGLQALTLWKVVKLYSAGGVSTTPTDPLLSLKEIELPTFDQYDPRLGTNDEILFIEFTDYECPFCARHAVQTFPLLVNKYKDRMTYVLMDFPLENIHPRARTVSKYVNCVYKKYGSERAFELKDFIYSTRDQWVERDIDGVREYIRNYLNGRGMDVEECVGLPEVDNEITEDLIAAVNTYRFNGTPSFIIAMKGVTGDELEELEALLEDYSFAGLRYRLARSGDYVAVLTSGALPFEVFDSILQYAG